jgi:hypothetical protein
VERVKPAAGQPRRRSSRHHQLMPRGNPFDCCCCCRGRMSDDTRRSASRKGVADTSRRARRVQVGDARILALESVPMASRREAPTPGVRSIATHAQLEQRREHWQWWPRPATTGFVGCDEAVSAVKRLKRWASACLFSSIQRPVPDLMHAGHGTDRRTRNTSLSKAIARSSPCG